MRFIYLYIPYIYSCEFVFEAHISFKCSSFTLNYHAILWIAKHIYLLQTTLQWVQILKNKIYTSKKHRQDQRLKPEPEPEPELEPDKNKSRSQGPGPGPGTIARWRTRQRTRHRASTKEELRPDDDDENDNRDAGQKGEQHGGGGKESAEVTESSSRATSVKV